MELTKIPAGGLQVRQASCHDTCLEVEGPNKHIANVNPVGFTSPEKWRVDCDFCFGCVTASCDSKQDALAVAMRHVKFSREEYMFTLQHGVFPVPCDDCGVDAGQPCQTGCPAQD